MAIDFKRINAYIDGHRQEIVDFLSRMISFPSVNPCPPQNGQELELQVWLRDRFQEIGFDKVDYWAVDPEGKRPNLVGVIQGRGGAGERGSRSLILNGHCDVVPVQVEERAKWKTDPWQAMVRDGKLYGRGASDMKGGLAALIWAAKSLIDCKVELAGDLMVESVVGEESGEGATVGVQAAIDRGYQAPFAVVGEPTNGDIRVSSPGIFFFELVIPGKEAHISDRNQVIFPQKHGVASGSQVGVDAILKAIPFIEMFQRLEVQWNQRWQDRMLPEESGIGTYTINPCHIHGGNYGASVVAGECRLVYNVRYPSGLNDEDLWEELRGHVKALASTDDWLREHPPEFKVPVIRRWKPMLEVPVDHPGVRALAGAFQSITGRDPKFTSFKGMGDTTFLTQSGIPAVLFGPGDHNCGIHGPNEHVDLEEVIQCVKIYARMVLEWCGRR